MILSLLGKHFLVLTHTQLSYRWVWARGDDLHGQVGSGACMTCKHMLTIMVSGFRVGKEPEGGLQPQ